MRGNNNVPGTSNVPGTWRESNVPGITAEVKPAENDKTRFQVILTVDQKIKKGVFDGELVIKTNDSNKGEVKVPLKGVIL